MNPLSKDETRRGMLDSPSPQVQTDSRDQRMYSEGSERERASEWSFPSTHTMPYALRVRRLQRVSQRLRRHPDR